MAGEEEPPTKRYCTRRIVRLEAEEKERNSHYDSSRPSIDTLSDDDLMLIFKKLGLHSRFNLQAVCKRWLNVFKKSCLTEHKFGVWEVFKRPYCTWREVVSVLSLCPNLHSLDLTGQTDSLSKKHITQLVKYCPDLKALNLSRNKVSTTAFLPLGHLAGLESLCLDGIRCSNPTGLDLVLKEAFSTCAALKRVVLSRTTIRGLCLAGLNPDTLEDLDLSHCRLMHPDLPVDKNFPELRELKATSLAVFKPFLQSLLPAAPRLTELDLSTCDAALLREFSRVVGKLEQLRSLHLAGGIRLEMAEACVSALTDDDCPCRTRLRYLDLSAAHMKPETVKRLGRLSGLEEVRLVAMMDFGFSDRYVTPESIGVLLAGCRSLTKITLRGFGLLDDTCLAAIGSYCPLLVHLDVAACRKVTDDGFKSLISGLRSTDRRPEGLGLKVFAQNSGISRTGSNAVSSSSEGQRSFPMDVDLTSFPPLHPAVPTNFIATGARPFFYGFMNFFDDSSDSDSDDDLASESGSYGFPDWLMFDGYDEDDLDQDSDSDTSSFAFAF